MKTNRIEDPDINPCSYSQLILTKEPKTHSGEKTASSTNIAEKPNTEYVPRGAQNKYFWENWVSPSRILKLGHCLSPYTNI
jgi:hypothetical protein